ncbi:hypothetical protein Y1Q_0001666 [Alligator mississippiensis]|uniref:Uncharacterized protein n=1 Tax=Alligator mississippiensis TaxID=8496 RepID=A0A151MAB4_ALLMI|nr:hypothetical protein Y1Q_0001666 [Alligator mississippiensis]
MGASSGSLHRECVLLGLIIDPIQRLKLIYSLCSGRIPHNTGQCFGLLDLSLPLARALYCQKPPNTVCFRTNHFQTRGQSGSAHLPNLVA